MNNINPSFKKTCSKCNIEKTTDDFYKKVSWCKECWKLHRKKYWAENLNLMKKRSKGYYKKHKNYYKEYRRKNKSKLQQNFKKWIYKTKYNLTLEQIEEMRTNQNNKCVICSKEFVNRKHMHVDHNHKTNKIRQLLCSKCNTGIGCFDENVHTLSKAIEYLNKWVD